MVGFTHSELYNYVFIYFFTDIFAILINDLPSNKSEIISLLVPISRLGAKFYREPNDINSVVAIFENESDAVSATSNSCISNCRVKAVPFDLYAISSLEPIT